jgi:hypothetical protein
MANTKPFRRVSSQLVVKWALVAGASAGILSLPLLIPILMPDWRATTTLGLGAIVSGTLVGALLAVLFQVIGRLRFWLVALGLSGFFLAFVAATGDVRRGTLPILACLVAAIALSLWQLLAYSLYVLRKHRH